MGFWDGSEGFGIPAAFQGLGGVQGCCQHPTGRKSGNFSIKLPIPRPWLHPHPAPTPGPQGNGFPGKGILSSDPSPVAAPGCLWDCSLCHTWISAGRKAGCGTLGPLGSGSRSQLDPPGIYPRKGWTTSPGPAVAPSGSGALPDPRSSAKALREEKLWKNGDP